MSEKCCIHGCQEIGKQKLSKIEGKVYVKPELINTIPRDWLLCEKHFTEKAEKLDCCIEKCCNTASTNELPEEQRIKIKIKQNCCHQLICLNHFKRFNNIMKVPNLPAIKREPIEPTKDQMPVEKKKSVVKKVTKVKTVSNQPVTPQKVQNENETEEMKLLKEKINQNLNLNTIASNQKQNTPIRKMKSKKINVVDDDSDTADDDDIVQLKKHKSETESEHQMEEDKKKCCMENCTEDGIEEHFLIHNNLFICQKHKKELLYLLRKSILMKQIKLNNECIHMIPSIDHHPLINYPMLNIDKVCLLCFKKCDCPWKCNQCETTYCSNCFKLVNNTNQNEHWTCCNCIEKPFDRNIILKKELNVLLQSIQRSILKVNSEEYQQKIKEEQKEIDMKRNEILEKRNKILSFHVWLYCILPQTINQHKYFVSLTEKKSIESTQKENIFIMSKTARQYMLLPHFSSLTTSQFLDMSNILNKILNENDQHILFKMISTNIDLDTVSLSHSQQYVDILQQIITNQTEWIPKLQLDRLMKKNVNFTYSMLLMKLSLETTEAVCDGVRIFKTANKFKNAIVFCGANGGRIGIDGILNFNSQSVTNTSLNEIGDFDNENDKFSKIKQPENPLGFPLGIQSNDHPKMIYQSLLINYLSTAMKFALKEFINEKIGLLIIGNKESEQGTLSILQNEINENKIDLYIMNNSVESNESVWFTIKEQLQQNIPSLLFVSIHTEDYSMKNDLSLFTTISHDLHSFTSNNNMKIVHLINSGFIQECDLKVYEGITKSYISSLLN